MVCGPGLGRSVTYQAATGTSLPQLSQPWRGLRANISSLAVFRYMGGRGNAGGCG